jgi:DNA-binding MarR family transcriptional regulator
MAPMPGASVSPDARSDARPLDPRLLDALEDVAVGVVGVTSAVFAADPPIDLTLLQWRTLVVVTEADDGVRISDVAARVGTSLPSASRLVDRLARRDLVTVEPDAAARRARVVRPSRAGTALRRRLIGRRRDMLSERLSAANLPTDLLSGLETIGRALADRR